MAQGHEVQEEEGGILGSSTLKALQGFTAASGNGQAQAKIGGPLVGYGSDSDDD